MHLYGYVLVLSHALVLANTKRMPQIARAAVASVETYLESKPYDILRQGSAIGEEELLQEDPVSRS